MKRYLSVIAFLTAASAVSAQDVSVTVYNQNRAVVRDVRKLELKSGVSTVSFKDVAARIDPTTVHFRPVLNPENLQVLEQNFEYDLASSQTILDKYVDQSIRLFTEKGAMYRGTLLSGAGDVVIQDSLGGVQVVQRAQIERFDFPKLPDGLITRPTLVWMVDNQGSVKQDVEVSYMTDGMNWHAEYVAVASSDDKSLDLSGWVSIENQSGIGYPNAKLKLVAGDVNIIQPPQEPMYRLQKLDVASASSVSQFDEKAFFEYHLYTLQRKADLLNNQTKQISLFPPAMTKVEKVFIYDGARNDKKINVRLEFKNGKTEGLGMPLPKGKVRVYKKDTDGSLEFIGEDQIDHTPVDEKIRLSLGNAFDLTGERVQKDIRKTGDQSQEITVEITLRNHKKDDVKITAVEHLWGDWKIKESNFPFVKKDANTAEFAVPVPAQKDTVLTYTAKTKW
jgi:hypothetical protein